jgi:hypothetical protein
VAAFGTNISDAGDNGVLFLGAAVGVGGVLLGMLIGSGQHRWTPLYP